MDAMDLAAIFHSGQNDHGGWGDLFMVIGVVGLLIAVGGVVLTRAGLRAARKPVDHLPGPLLLLAGLALAVLGFWLT
ncbi:hypothetical protein GCM10009665_35820 [Kitasatospora nipponensis]|uniref:Uncharacterized protein n=1 Tax=Kitasatospora nipponensis TaxID=258049 RepID=A0ABN1W9M8_9ACTN